MMTHRFARPLLFALLAAAPAVRAAPADPLEQMLAGTRSFAAGTSTHPDQGRLLAIVEPAAGQP